MAKNEKGETETRGRVLHMGTTPACSSELCQGCLFEGSGTCPTSRCQSQKSLGFTPFHGQHIPQSPGDLLSWLPLSFLETGGRERQALCLCPHSPKFCRRPEPCFCRCVCKRKTPIMTQCWQWDNITRSLFGAINWGCVFCQPGSRLIPRQWSCFLLSWCESSVWWVNYLYVATNKGQGCVLIFWMKENFLSNCCEKSGVKKTSWTWGSWRP